MRPKLQKRSVLKFAGRIIPGAKRRGKTNKVKFEMLVELYPPLRGIVQLTNSDTLRFRNWSFTNRTIASFIPGARPEDRVHALDIKRRDLKIVNL